MFDWKWMLLPRLQRDHQGWDLWEAHWIEHKLGLLNGLLILDVGSGDGSFIGALQSFGAWAHGIDIKPLHPSVMEATFPDLSTAPLLPTYFELVCFRESLYYTNVQRSLDACRYLGAKLIYIKSSYSEMGFDELESSLRRSSYEIWHDRDYPYGIRRHNAHRYMVLARCSKTTCVI